MLDHSDGVRTIAGLKMAAFEDPLEFVGTNFPSGLRTGLSFGDIPNGHERYLRAVQQRWEWWQALPERPDVLILHQESIGRALANLIWEDDPNGRAARDPRRSHPCAAHGPLRPDHDRQQRHGGRRRPVRHRHASPSGLALLDFDKATGALTATDLVQMNPSTSAARAQRVITDTPDCDDELVFCHDAPDLPDAPATPTPGENR